MSLVVPRYVDSNLPPKTWKRRHYWVPSIASLAFTAVIGMVLLLQAFSIQPGRPSSVESSASLVESATRLPEPPPGREQSTNRSASLRSPLRDVTSDLPGYGVPPLSTIGLRTGELQQVTEASPVASAASSAPDATATPESIATPEREGGVFAGCESHGPLYCVYEVKQGETLASIARLAGLQSSEEVAAHDLLVYSNRAALNTAEDLLEAGEKLRIPLGQGILHTVISQETLSEIARRYGVLAQDIVDVPGNKIRDQDALTAGAEILVPNPTRLGQALAVPGPSGSGGGLGLLSWPAIGDITSYFGPAHPLGVDIALMPGDRVTAAAHGTVSFSGGDPCCSYGLFVIIDHGSGMHTLYGHLSRLYVEEGDRVDRGEAIGLGGYTGFGTGPHLHFEVHVGKALADPLVYLP